jgi:hypothetical protein
MSTWHFNLNRETVDNPKRYKPRIPDLNRKTFARTNSQTIAQRVALMLELAPNTHSITEVCCGDGTRQCQAYTSALSLHSFRGLDIEPNIAASNRKQGVQCICGNALDKECLRQFIQDDVIFFGPPLSENCDAHHLLVFNEVLPGFGDFARLLLGELNYSGLLVCICPNTTSMGNITQLYRDIHRYRPDVNLRLIHHTYSTITGNDEVTEMRLKYIELWFSNQLADLWEVRESRP